MTKEELLNKTNWDDHEMAVCPIFVNLFDRIVPFNILQEYKATPSITDKTTACVNDILLLDKSELETIKDMLWEECQFAFQVSDYGFEPEAGETHLEAHLKGFGISSREDAYSKCNIKGIHIYQDGDKFENRYSVISVDTASDNLIDVIVKNGKIIDFDYNGTSLGFFEEDEQHAKKCTSKDIERLTTAINKTTG